MTITECVNSLKVLCLQFLLLALWNPTANAKSYGGYGHFTLGSSRVIGLGGAYTAVSNDSNAFLYNPAGVATNDVDLQFEAATGQLKNNELDLNRDGGMIETLTQQYDLVGAHYKKGRVSIGIGYIVPYSVEIKQLVFSGAIKNSLKIQEVGVNLSYELNKVLAIGINGKSAEAIQTESVTNAQYEMTSALIYYQWGVIYHKNRLALGYSFSPELYWPKTNSKSTTFLDVKSPQKQTFGISYFIKPDKIRLNVDIVNLKKVTDSVAFEDNLNLVAKPIYEDEVTFTKFGLEFLLVQNSRTNAQFRLGYYSEPSRFSSTESRRHITIGFEVRLGPALLQVAQDQAENYNGTSQAFSILFDRL